MDANYGIIMWFYVNSWDKNYNSQKYILSRYLNDTETSQDIEAYLDATNNNLVVNFAQQSTMSTSTIQNIPLQKWVCLGISKFNNTIDIYIDGKLADTKIGIDTAEDPDPTSSFILHGFTDGSGTKTKGFDGYTRNFKYYSRPLSPIEVYNVYKSSANGTILDNLIGNYKLKLSFFKNDEEVAEVGLG